MTLIILALLAVVFVALNCFYNLTGLVGYVFQSATGNAVGKDEVSKLSMRRFEEENYVFSDSDFEK